MLNTSKASSKKLFHISREQVIVDLKIFFIAIIVLVVGLVFYTKYAQQYITSSHASEGTSAISIFTPVADTYANQSSPTNTYEKKEQLITKNGKSTKKNIYLKFDLTMVQTPITGVRLREHVSDGSTATQNYRLVMDSSWSDRTLSYTRQPVMPSTVVATTSNTQKDTWIEVPLDEIASQIQGKVITIMIDTPAGDDVFGIDSSETKNSPQLIVSTSSMGGPIKITSTTAPTTVVPSNPQVTVIPSTGPSPTSRPVPTDIPQPTEFYPTNTPGPSATLAPVSGKTYFIAPNGSDSNPGTQTAPLKSFNKAMSMLRPGDMLYMRGGDYTENVKPNLTAGRADARITMKAYPNEQPVIHGLFIVSSPTYWVFDGLNVVWSGIGATSGDHMTKFTGGSSWELKNCEIWGAHSYAGMSITGFTNNWSIHDCIFHDTYKSNSTNQDHLIYANDASFGLIEHNLFLNSENGRGVKLGPPSGGGAGPNHITVRYNTFYNNTGPANIQVSGGTSDNLFEKNILVRPASGMPAITVNSGYFGKNSIARGNLVWQASGVYESGIVDGGGNINNTIDPQINFNVAKRADGSYILDSTSFRPANSAAAAYGRYGN
jgi:hypothetical protein